MKAADWLTLALVSLLTVAVRLPDLAMPLERDEGEYAYAAQEMARGFPPYRDSFCQKPPLVFFWYLAGFQVFGETVVGIHLTLTVAAAAAAAALYLLGRRLAGRPAGVLAAILFTLASPGVGYFGSAANTEIFMLVPVIFGVHCLLAAGDGGRLPWLGAGILAGLAIWTKQVAVFSFLGPYLFVAVQVYQRAGARALAAGTLLAGLGVVAASLPLLAWIVANQIGGPFWEAVLTHNLAYVGFPYGPAKWVQVADSVRRYFAATDGPLWAAVLLGVLALAWRPFRADPAIRFTALWCGSSLLGVAVGPYVFGHYFLQVLPPLALMPGVLGRRVALRFPSLAPYRKLLGGLLLAVLGVPLLVPLVVAWVLPVDVRCDEQYQRHGPPPFVAARDLGAYLRRTTAPEDRVLIVGSEPEVLFYARRRSATRYTIFYPLTGNFPRAEEMIRELFDETAARPPARVILCYCPTSFIVDRPGKERVDRIFAHLGRVLQDGYQEEARLWVGDPARVLLTHPGDPHPPAGCLFALFRQEPR
jgi:4-amino-4-deoxy-L-arabinose transferase-like glycosyltransferase